MITHNPNHKKTGQVEAKLPPDFLYSILGPTAAGKTALAVALAKEISGEIISVDSRQVYRGMDIGTGKDLASYGNIPHHLIDIRDPQDRYDIFQFQQDFDEAFHQIITNDKKAIAVGGTGMYLHSLFVSQPYIQVPIDLALRERLLPQGKPELIAQLQTYQIPTDFQIDHSSHKRLIRAIEILEALQAGFTPSQSRPHYDAHLFGLDPDVALRRQHITARLQERIAEGLLEEVEGLLNRGLTHQDLQYYGLEYKYSSLYLLGELSKSSFTTKLETEIHRYAKRQMTFFRKMEKDGVVIHWLKTTETQARLEEILTYLTAKQR